MTTRPPRPRTVPSAFRWQVRCLDAACEIARPVRTTTQAVADVIGRQHLAKYQHQCAVEGITEEGRIVRA